MTKTPQERVKQAVVRLYEAIDRALAVGEELKQAREAIAREAVRVSGIRLVQEDAPIDRSPSR